MHSKITSRHRSLSKSEGSVPLPFNPYGDKATLVGEGGAIYLGIIWKPDPHTHPTSYY